MLEKAIEAYRLAFFVLSRFLCLTVSYTHGHICLLTNRTWSKHRKIVKDALKQQTWPLVFDSTHHLLLFEQGARARAHTFQGYHISN